MSIKSTTFCTRNENGDREIVIEYERDLLDWILRRNGKVITIVQHSISSMWYHKGSGKKVSSYLDLLAMEIIERHRQLTDF